MVGLLVLRVVSFISEIMCVIGFELFFQREEIFQVSGGVVIKKQVQTDLNRNTVGSISGFLFILTSQSSPRS